MMNIEYMGKTMAKLQSDNLIKVWQIKMTMVYNINIGDKIWQKIVCTVDAEDMKE